MPLYLGNQKIKTLYVGGQKIKEAWTMVGGVMRKVHSSFTPMGMIRAADGNITTATPIKTIGWSADPAFPGSVAVNNGLQVNGSVAAVLNFSGTFYPTFSMNMNIAAYVNGVQRGSTWTFAMNAYNNNVRSGSIPISVNAGEVVDLYAWSTNAFTVTVRAGTTWSIVPA
ncbi:hypothetical protein ACFWMS_26430 [Peribacillus butanolivorans]|uniref:hypothetical protein n=1 Tax=Peribacillus butanolivorans TaxID=421767 RepID=UPI00365FE92E